jgi:hypothetical protein
MAKQPASDQPVLRTFGEVTKEPNQHIEVNLTNFEGQTLIVYGYNIEISRFKTEYPVITAQIPDKPGLFDVSGGREVLKQLQTVASEDFPFAAKITVLGRAAFFEI